jgi:hypothetical protein
MSTYTAVGVVYDLKQTSDINGAYKVVSVESAAGGSTAFAIKNSRGVLIEMTSIQRGMNFNLGPGAVTLALRPATD